MIVVWICCGLLVWNIFGWFMGEADEDWMNLG